MQWASNEQWVQISKQTRVAWRLWLCAKLNNFVSMSKGDLREVFGASRLCVAKIPITWLMLTWYATIKQKVLECQQIDWFAVKEGRSHMDDERRTNFCDGPLLDFFYFVIPGVWASNIAFETLIITFQSLHRYLGVYHRGVGEVTSINNLTTWMTEM